MVETTFIYALKEPDTGEIRYIGQSKDPQDRFGQHCGTKEKCHRGNWIQALKKSGRKPILEIVDEVPYEFRSPLEAAYVQFFREQGCSLVNGTPGGESPPNATGKKRSPEFCAEISARQLGRKMSPEACANNAAAQLGNKRGPYSPEHRAKISTGQLGKIIPMELRARWSVLHTGKKLSAEHCAKISLGMLGKKRGPYRKKKQELPKWQ